MLQKNDDSGKAGMQSEKAEIKVVHPSQGTTLAVAGDNYRVIISGAQTDNSYSVFDMLVPPGGGPPPHEHPDMQEFFYVTQGQLTFKTQQGHQKVAKGGFVHIPYNGGIHCFKNESDTTARVLCTVMPAGLEEVFSIVGQPVAPGVFLPPPEMTAETEDKLKKLGDRFKQRIYPPDYLD